MKSSELIVYACPSGELADQIDRYYAISKAQVGANAAHKYMPHCTLTGFFHDDPQMIGDYTAALGDALRRAWPERPGRALEIERVELGEQFIGLILHGAWLKTLVADFARSAHSPTRRDTIRLKDWLHLSLAYEFHPQQHAALASLARDMVDIRAPVAWELRFYERHEDGSWTCHANWPLPSRVQYD